MRWYTNLLRALATEHAAEPQGPLEPRDFADIFDTIYLSATWSALGCHVAGAMGFTEGLNETLIPTLTTVAEAAVVLGLPFYWEKLHAE